MATAPVTVADTDNVAGNGINDIHVNDNVDNVVNNGNDVKLNDNQYDVNKKEIIIVIISDTHGHHDKIEIPLNADILIHCGDWTNFSNYKHLISFNQWLSTIKHIPKERKLIITGNHEVIQNFELKAKIQINWNKHLCNGTMLNAHKYSNNNIINLYGIKIYGIGWKGNTGSKSWNCIPQHIDILITHNPPFNILDCGTGCQLLSKRISKVQPLIHCFGHAHEGYGIYKDIKSNIMYINASSVNYQRKPIHEPILIKITKQNNIFIEVMNNNSVNLFRNIHHNNGVTKPQRKLPN